MGGCHKFYVCNVVSMWVKYFVILEKKCVMMLKIVLHLVIMDSNNWIMCRMYCDFNT
jgi:hypothetical protein